VLARVVPLSRCVAENVLDKWKRSADRDEAAPVDEARKHLLDLAPAVREQLSLKKLLSKRFEGDSTWSI
jgi:hypothetical protein